MPELLDTLNTRSRYWSDMLNQSMWTAAPLPTPEPPPPPAPITFSEWTQGTDPDLWPSLRLPEGGIIESTIPGAPLGCECTYCQGSRRARQVAVPSSSSGATPSPETVQSLRDAWGLGSDLSFAGLTQTMRSRSSEPRPVVVEEPTPPMPDAQAMRGYIPRAVRADWRTPDNVLAPVRIALGGEIDIDPCASTEHWLSGGDEIGELENFHQEDDGLTKEWHGRLLPLAPTVYVNPPFNRNRDWVAKCVEEARQGCEIVLLIPARTDTRYWQRHIAPTAQGICFWRGRIRFVGARTGAPFPCALVYWGPNFARFKAAFEPYGQVLETGNAVLTEGA